MAVVFAGVIVFLAAARWAGRSIEHIDGVFHEMRPEGDGTPARLACGPNHLHDGADGPFRDAVELVHVRGTSSSSDRLSVEEFIELVGQEFAGVVHLQLANYPNRLGLADAGERVQFGDEGANAFECFVLVLEKIDLFEARVIVDKYEKV